LRYFRRLQENKTLYNRHMSEVAQDNVKYTDFLNIIQISWLHKVRNSFTEQIIATFPRNICLSQYACLRH
jgi:hypothetical protein